MRHGYIRAASGVPDVRTADCRHNAEQAAMIMAAAADAGVHLLALPSLCLTGRQADFFQTPLLDGAVEALLWLSEMSVQSELLTFVGLPLPVDGKIYACAAAVARGTVLGIVPQSVVRGGSPFAPAPDANTMLCLEDRQVPFGRNILFACETVPSCVVGVELDDDFWAPVPASTALAHAGASVIVSMGALTEELALRRFAAAAQSRRLHCGVVQSGHALIAENGALLAELTEPGWAAIELDTELLESERRRDSLFTVCGDPQIWRVGFSWEMTELTLTRPVTGGESPQTFYEEYSRRWGFAPSKLLRLAMLAFEGQAEPKALFRELQLFLDLTMPGDAHVWKAELEAFGKKEQIFQKRG